MSPPGHTLLRFHLNSLYCLRLCGEIESAKFRGRFHHVMRAVAKFFPYPFPMDRISKGQFSVPAAITQRELMPSSIQLSLSLSLRPHRCISGERKIDYYFQPTGKGLSVWETFRGERTDMKESFNTIDTICVSLYCKGVPSL